MSLNILLIEAGCAGLTLLSFREGEWRVWPMLALMALMWAGWALMLGRGGGRGASTGAIIGFALLFYLTLLPGRPLFDDDIHRYLWDGKVTLSGINPYRYAPADPALAGLKGEGDARIGYPRLPTPYPPAAQLLFAAMRLVSGGNVTAAKAFLGFFFFGSVLLLIELLDMAGRDRRLVLLWAWNPLVLKEFANSGHVEAAAVCLLLGAVLLLFKGRETASGILLAASALVKFFPLFAAPFLFFRARRKSLWLSAFLASGVLLYLPFLGAGAKVTGSLGTYLRWWLFNHGAFEVLERLSAALFPGSGPAAARALYWGAAAIAAFILGRRAREKKSADFSLALGTFLFSLAVLSPAVMPWYVCWSLPFLVFGRFVFVPGFALLSQASYLYYWRHRDMPWARWAEYGMLSLLVWMDWRRRRAMREGRAPAASLPGVE